MRPIIRNSLIVLGVVVSTEILYEIYCKIRRDWKKRAIFDLNEVLFTNNLSTKCSLTHEKDYVCPNSFCFIRNSARIVQLIESSSKSISICMYIFTFPEIGEAIIRAKNRGVIVRLVGCESMAYSTASVMTKLSKNNIPVRTPNDNSDKLMHHKFCLIDVDWIKISENSDSGKVYENEKSINENCENKGDGKKKSVFDNKNLVKPKLDTVKIPAGGLLIQGSLNWTKQAFTSNWDNVIITNQKDLVFNFQKEFQRIWDDFSPMKQMKR